MRRSVAQGREIPGQTSDEQLAYAFMNGSNNIAVIDLARKAVLGRFSVAGNPHGGTITPDGRFIYTASMGSEKIYVVDARSGETIDSIELGKISHHSAVSPDGRYVYVAADRAAVIDTASNELIERIATDEPPRERPSSPSHSPERALHVRPASIFDGGGARTHRAPGTRSPSKEFW